MFELDYLTQRLTFTRASDMTNPRLIGGYAPTFERRGRGPPGRQRRAAGRRSSTRSSRSSATGGRPVVDAEDGLWAVVIADALLRAAARATDGRAGAGMSGRDDVRRPSRRQPRSAARSSCRAERLPPRPARPVSPWTGEPGTAGTVAVVGAGKMGLPLAAQFASHGWSVIAVDIDPARRRRRSTPASRMSARSRASPTSSRTPMPPAASGPRSTAPRRPRAADVVVLIVPVMLDDESRPDHRIMDSAVEAIAPGRPRRLDGHLRDHAARRRHPRPVRAAPRREASGLDASTETLLRRVLARAPVQRRRAAQPRHLPEARRRARRRRRRRGPPRSTTSVLDAEVVAMSSAEAAEFAKLADTTYRDVNIALANEFARYADRIGVDITEVIAAANSQPYSHIHQPGLGVGGHCIPVYPHFLLAGRRSWSSSPCRARSTTARSAWRSERSSSRSAASTACEVLVLGLTYRDGVKELAYSRALPLIERLAFHGATRPGATTRCYRRRDRPDRRDAVDAGASRAGRPGDRHPDRRPACSATLDSGVVPEPRAALRRPQLPARPRAAGRRRVPGGRRAPGRPRGVARRGAGPLPLRARADRQRRRDPAPADQGGRARRRSCARATTRSSSTPASTTTRRMAGASSPSSACPRPTTAWASAAGRQAEQTGRDADRPRADPRRRRARTPSSSTATRTRRWPARSRPRSWRSRSPTSRPACASSTGGCPRRSTGSSPTTCRAGCSPRRRPPSPTWRAEGIVTASTSSAT